MPRALRGEGYKGKGKAGKSKLMADDGNRHVPGHLGREKVKTAQGRVGYTQGETKFGAGGKGRKWTLPS